jgi:hypothetical protein
MIRAPFFWLFCVATLLWPAPSSAQTGASERHYVECCRRSTGGPPPWTPPPTGQQ